MNNNESVFNVSNLLSDKEKRSILRDRPKEPYGEYPRRIWVHPVDYDRSDLRNAWVVQEEEEGAVEFVKADSVRSMEGALSNMLAILSDPYITSVDKVSFAKPILESILESRS